MEISTSDVPAAEQAGKETPSPTDSSVSLSVPFQVAGHTNTVETTADGSFVIKSSLPGERAFYETLACTLELSALRQWVPEFYGILRLEGVMRSQGKLDPPPADLGPAGKESLLLENMCQYVIKTNVMDVKLGRVLYAEDASAQKRAKMEKKARTSTTGETGIRLTGFHVYNRISDTQETYPRAYGYSLTAPRLIEGINAFFPCATSPDEIGHPPELLATILEGIEDDVEELIEVLEKLELRIVGTSLLVVYEGEGETLREVLKRQEVLQVAAEEGEGNEEEEDGEEEMEDEELEETPKLPWVVRLIDFAHSHLAPGRGPDEGAIFGLRTFLRLVRERREAVEKLMEIPSDA
ncbi:SAICAR synthase-like protein [Dacryopinax primogenitus]|uniref:Kinase n=1 Tax=Dacryopinax primogenitus (strain DJM 731) TaxID=1858805 RepID=M5G657_DACPD|nr:SAICAR synthase-like protein [Dacryopinax primogenitus]EJU05741.1 SAICAR synthase-like protein [Dacryopinax primogenitus]